MCCVRLQPYIDKEEFHPEVISRVSGACTALCMWVRSMHTYYNVLQIVEPKRKVAADATAAFEVRFKLPSQPNDGKLK